MHIWKARLFYDLIMIVLSVREREGEKEKERGRERESECMWAQTVCGGKGKKVKRKNEINDKLKIKWFLLWVCEIKEGKRENKIQREIKTVRKWKKKTKIKLNREREREI